MSKDGSVLNDLGSILTARVAAQLWMNHCRIHSCRNWRVTMHLSWTWSLGRSGAMDPEVCTKKPRYVRYVYVDTFMYVMWPYFQCYRNTIQLI